MARRIELRGIANAINVSFVSRNNDYAGYWAIDQLKLQFQQRILFQFNL